MTPVVLGRVGEYGRLDQALERLRVQELAGRIRVELVAERVSEARLLVAASALEVRDVHPDVVELDDRGAGGPAVQRLTQPQEEDENQPDHAHEEHGQPALPLSNGIQQGLCLQPRLQ